MTNPQQPEQPTVWPPISAGPEGEQMLRPIPSSSILPPSPASLPRAEGVDRCCTCGYEWPAGKSGAHYCSEILVSRLTQAESELAELRSWKESAMIVLNQIDLQELGKALGFKLGSNVSPQILPAVIALKSELADAKEEHLIDMGLYNDARHDLSEALTMAKALEQRALASEERATKEAEMADRLASALNASSPAQFNIKEWRLVQIDYATSRAAPKPEDGREGVK